MNQKNKNCELLEKQALQKKGKALNEWREHAEKCPDCHSRLEIIEKLQGLAGNFDVSLGTERFEVIRQAVINREKKISHLQFLKYAAILLVLFVCVFVLRSPAEKEDKTISRKKKPVMLQEKTELAWDFTQDTDALLFKIKRLKRKVFFSDLRNEDFTSFKFKCRSIRKQTYKLKNAEQI